MRERKLLEEQKHKEMGIIIGIISIFIVLPIAVASWENSNLSSEQFLLTLRETELLNVEHAYAYYHIKSIEIYQNLTTDFLLTQYLNKENLTENYNTKYLPMLALAQEYIQKANELKNDESHNVTELYNQAKNITNQNKLTTICNRVAIISASLAVIMSIFIAYDFYYGKKREQKDESMWNKIKNSLNVPKIVGIILIVLGFIISIITAIIASLVNFTDITLSVISIYVSFTLGLISIGIAFISIGLSMESDEKMKSVVNTEFLHAVNMLEDTRIEFIKTLNFIDSLASVPSPTAPPNPSVPTTSSTPNSPTLSVPIPTTPPTQSPLIIPLTPGYSPELYTWKTESSIEMAVELLKRDKEKKYIEKKYRDKLFDYFITSLNHFIRYPILWNEKKSLNHLATCYAMLEEHYDNSHKEKFYGCINEHAPNAVKKAEFLALIQSAKENLSRPST